VIRLCSTEPFRFLWPGLRSGVVAYDVTLERRIRELCAQAVAARETDDVQPILSELREALREHVEQLKGMVAEYPFLTVDINKVVPFADATQKLRANGKKKAG
jgi:hypothetical protein